MAETAWDWEEVFDSINHHLVITDGEGIVLYANEAVEKVYLKSREEIVGRSVEELERERIFNPSITKIVLQTGTKQTLIQETIQGLKLLVTATPIFDAAGHIRLVVSYSHDITELVRLREYVNLMEEQMKLVRNELDELRAKEQEGIIASSQAIKQVLQAAQRIAGVDVAVLLTGESGVGKNLIARYIHKRSKRKNGPLVEINCGGIPESLLESELFGYLPGSFSGASPHGKKGLVEVAEGGTLFLDEIGELSLNLQVKLLTLIQEKRFFPVGSTKMRQVDFRLIAATNVDLAEMVRFGKFRRDLYYRLSVVPIRIPPLRERPEDLLQMIVRFTERFNKIYERKKRLHEQVIDRLMRYDWPGNVRELENMIERLVLTVDKEVIQLEDLPPYLIAQEAPPYSEGKGLQEMLDEFEAQIIRHAYQKCGSTPKMARMLGISQPTALRKLQKYKARL